MCNLSRKEGSSLFAVLAKRQRKTLPKNLHPHAEQLCISFWPVELPFGRQPHRLNKKHVNWKKPSLVDGGGHVTACVVWGSGVGGGLLPRVPRGDPGFWDLNVNVTCKTLCLRSVFCMLPAPGAFSEVPTTGGCLACFPFLQGQDQFYRPIHFKVTCILLSSRAARHQFWGGK